jgi:nitroreductase
LLKLIKNIARDLLAITWIRRLYVFLNRVVLEGLGFSRILIHIYYFFAPLTFNREQSAVWRGRRDYYRQKNRPRVSHVGLRRNIHRLEKALIMQPRRPVFAADYIVETVEFYKTMVHRARTVAEPYDADELDWAHDVLREYFASITGESGKIDAARALFATVETDVPGDLEPERVPRPKQQLSSITYDDMLALAQQRRSVRWYQDTPVPHELLDQAMLVARQAPTACNRLPYEFRIFDKPDMVSKVISLPFGAAGFGQNVKTVVVVVGKLSSYFSPRDRHAIYVDSSLAAMSFIFALETLGLSSTVINWPDLEPLERTMQKTLGLEHSDRVVMLIAVGYADPTALVPYSQKKALDSIRRYNEFD